MRPLTATVIINGVRWVPEHFNSERYTVRKIAELQCYYCRLALPYPDGEFFYHDKFDPGSKQQPTLCEVQWLWRAYPSYADNR